MSVRLQRIVKYYNGHAARYEQKFRWPLLRRIRAQEEREIRAFLLKYLDPFDSRKVLELGCGSGAYTIFLAQRGFDLTAVDVSSAMLQELRQKLAEKNFSNVQILNRDVEEIPADLGPFDALFGIGLLEYADDPPLMIDRVKDFIKPNGIAVFSVPGVSVSGILYWMSSWIRKRIGMRLLTKRAFRTVFESHGLRVLEIQALGFHLPGMRAMTQIAAVLVP